MSDGLYSNLEEGQGLRSIGHVRFGLAHGGGRKPLLGRRHLEGTTTVATAGTGSGEARFGAFWNQFALKFGKAREDGEPQPTVRGRRADQRPFAGEHFQANLARCQIADQNDQITEISAEPVKLPD